jgi:phospholipase/carboxylesterase
MRYAKLGELNARVAGGDDGDGSGDGPVVVLLHGFGAPGDDLVPLWRPLSEPDGTRFVFPEAPVVLGREYMGGRSRRQAAGRRDVAEVPEGLEEARAKVDTLLEEIERAMRPPPNKVVLGGFSQGAMLSLDVALRSSRPLAGVVMMSGTHIAANEWASRFEARRGLPVFMSHGQDDLLLPFPVAEALRDTLVASGIPVQWVPFRGGHGIPPIALDRVRGFLRQVLS